MSTVLFLLLMMFAMVIVGLIGSFVLGFAGLIHQPANKLFGRRPALLVLTLTNGLIVVAWTAFVMLWVERGTPPYDPASWAAVVAGVLLMIAPVATAYQSSVGVIAKTGLTIDGHDLLRSLGYLTFVQMVSAAWMYFDRSTLHWWRWLPLTG